jgi:hypothetical protein
VIYVHLSHEALSPGRGVARVEQIGPILLTRLHTLLGDHNTINLKPVIDLPAGHTPIDSYEIPANLREHILLRYPADVFPYAAATTRRIDLDHTIPYLNPDKGGPPGQTRIGNPHPPPPPTQNPWPLADPTTQTRQLALAITPPPHLPHQQHRHPQPRQHPIRPSNLARRSKSIPCAHELRRPNFYAFAIAMDAIRQALSHGASESLAPQFSATEIRLMRGSSRTHRWQTVPAESPRTPRRRRDTRLHRQLRSDGATRLEPLLAP